MGDGLNSTNLDNSCWNGGSKTGARHHRLLYRLRCWASLAIAQTPLTRAPCPICLHRGMIRCPPGGPVEEEQSGSGHQDTPKQTGAPEGQAQTPTIWRRTDKWRPAQNGTASGCFAVESVGSVKIGLFKPTNVAPEKICADLARAVGVIVPEAFYGRVEGSPQTGAISMAHGKESLDLQHLQQQKPDVFASPKMTQGLRAASGLLAWPNSRTQKN